MINVEDIFKAYYDCRKNKRNTTNALEFELDLEKNLVELWEDINFRRYEIGTSIAFIVYKPKQREIFAATFRDRIVHHLVINKLNPLFEGEFIDDTYNCRKNKGVFYGVNALKEKIRIGSEDYTKDCYIGKFDVQGFFMGIHKPTLWKMLKEFIIKNYKEYDLEDILYLVEKIIMHSPEKNCIRRCPIENWNGLSKEKSLFTCGDDYGLPIGNLTSQIFANFYLSQFDKLCSAKFLYGRYVDDFYLIAPSAKEITDFIPIMREELSKLHCKLHPNKWEIQHYSKGVSFTGAVVKFDRSYMSNRAINNFEIKIRKFNGLSRKENAAKFVSVINSYLGFLRNYNNYGKRVEIMKLLDSDWLDYFQISDFKKVVLIKNNMITKFNKKENYIPIKNVSGKYVVAFNYVEDTIIPDYGTWTEITFDYKPGFEKIKSSIISIIDALTRDKIINDFRWNDYNVYLTIENQTNYNREYYLASSTNGKNLPVTFKFEKDGVSEFYTFKTLEELQQFYIDMSEHIRKVQSDGWETKNSINWDVYKI